MSYFFILGGVTAMRGFLGSFMALLGGEISIAAAVEDRQEAHQASAKTDLLTEMIMLPLHLTERCLRRAPTLGIALCL